MPQLQVVGTLAVASKRITTFFFSSRFMNHYSLAAPHFVRKDINFKCCPEPFLENVCKNNFTILQTATLNHLLHSVKGLNLKKSLINYYFFFPPTIGQWAKTFGTTVWGKWYRPKGPTCWSCITSIIGANNRTLLPEQPAVRSWYSNTAPSYVPFNCLSHFKELTMTGLGSAVQKETKFQKKWSRIL